MTSDTPPRFLSIDYHFRFFPKMLRGRLRPAQRRTTGFSPVLERYLALAGCFILVVLGLPAAVTHGSIAGWIAGGTGAAGLLALLVNSIASSRGEPPSCDEFLVGFFFFFVIAGISAGIFISSLGHYTFFHGLIVTAAGLVAGYVLGILAGFGLQYLGWLAAVFDSIAGLAVVGMLLVDLVLLGGTLF